MLVFFGNGLLYFFHTFYTSWVASLGPGVGTATVGWSELS